jgi:hypothetical protein
MNCSVVHRLLMQHANEFVTSVLMLLHLSGLDSKVLFWCGTTYLLQLYAYKVAESIWLNCKYVTLLVVKFISTCHNRLGLVHCEVPDNLKQSTNGAGTGANDTIYFWFCHYYL